MVPVSLCVRLRSQASSPLLPAHPGSGGPGHRQGDSVPPPPGSSRWQEAGGPNLEVTHQLGSPAIGHIHPQEIVPVVRCLSEAAPTFRCPLLETTSCTLPLLPILLSSCFTFPGITLQPHLCLHRPARPSLCCPLSPFPASPLLSVLSITGGRISPTPASLPRALSPRPLLPTTLGHGSPSRDLELGEDLI